MAYIDPVKWPEVQNLIVQRMKEQPRGYQAELAEKIGKTAGFVNHIVTGKRPIPDEHLDAILRSLNMTYDVNLTVTAQAPAGAEGEA